MVVAGYMKSATSLKRSMSTHVQVMTHGRTAPITVDRDSHKAMNSGIPKLDRLLGGGLEIGLMHLFYGSSSSVTTC